MHQKRVCIRTVSGFNVIVSSSLTQSYGGGISYDDDGRNFRHMPLYIRSNIACKVDTREVKIAHPRCLTAYLDSKK
jgi:hypothetical protein